MSRCLSPGWVIEKDLWSSRTTFVRDRCEAIRMSTSTEASITWAQALAWRMERQLLDPVGAESVAGVVRRLGAVLSMDESVAELAVRTRRTTSCLGELGAALAEGEVIKAFAFRGSMHYLSPEEGGMYLALRSAGRQWELPSWVEHYGLSPSGWLAGLPGRGACGAERRTVDPDRARQGVDQAPCVPAREVSVRRGRGDPDQAADLAGGHELRSAARWTAHVSAPRQQPEAGHPRP